MMLKTLHVSCVALSYALFLLRGVWLLRGSVLMRQRWVKIAPHVIDTVLLSSAVLLAWQLGYTPFNSPWLAAKIVMLLVYILLGMVAFRYAQTQRTRLIAWLLAQLSFFYIVATAITHDPYLTL